jgi:hypothetical protein
MCDCFTKQNKNHFKLSSQQLKTDPMFIVPGKNPVQTKEKTTMSGCQQIVKANPNPLKSHPIKKIKKKKIANHFDQQHNRANCTTPKVFPCTPFIVFHPTQLL